MHTASQLPPLTRPHGRSRAESMVLQLHRVSGEALLAEDWSAQTERWYTRLTPQLGTGTFQIHGCQSRSSDVFPKGGSLYPADGTGSAVWNLAARPQLIVRGGRLQSFSEIHDIKVLPGGGIHIPEGTIHNDRQNIKWSAPEKLWTGGQNLAGLSKRHRTA